MSANVRGRKYTRLRADDGGSLKESCESQEICFLYGMSPRQILNVKLTLHSLGLVNMDPSFVPFKILLPDFLVLEPSPHDASGLDI